MHGTLKQGWRLVAALWVTCCLLLGAPALAAEGSPAPPGAGPAFQNLPREILHEVERGQDLHLIAGYYYGDARQWERIWQANRGVVRNPNRLRPGMVLHVPVDRDWKQGLSYAEWIKVGGTLRPGGPGGAVTPTAPPAAPPPGAGGAAPAGQLPPGVPPPRKLPAPPGKRQGAAAHGFTQSFVFPVEWSSPPGPDSALTIPGDRECRLTRQERFRNERGAALRDL